MLIHNVLNALFGSDDDDTDSDDDTSLSIRTLIFIFSYVVNVLIQNGVNVSMLFAKANRRHYYYALKNGQYLCISSNFNCFTKKSIKTLLEEKKKQNGLMNGLWDR